MRVISVEDANRLSGVPVQREKAVQRPASESHANRLCHESNGANRPG